ncbi:MAG: nucleotide-diphospho-sugar transferase family protein [Bacteroidota bacterium]|nr:nucleotide-diphospho-sugar transferase family protein [Bacteroidota bacterium]
MNHFCTITTASHLYKVYALAESLKEQDAGFLLNVLIVDEAATTFQFENCRFFTLQDIKKCQSAAQIIHKYGNDKDKLRWSLKPVFMKHLLGQAGVDSVIYLDNDLFFYSDYRFLFDLLKEHSFLLTPHFYRNDPKTGQNWLEANFRLGLYNAGFVGANKSAAKTLQWWADCCLYRCEKNSFRGLFDDQKYLDIVPVMEKTAHIVRHKGCNVAGWNTAICKREIVDHRVKIDGRFDIVFIHFNETTIREIIAGSDAILFNYYSAYIEALRKHKERLEKEDVFFERQVIEQMKLGLWKIITELGI